MQWPSDPDELAALQRRLAAVDSAPWLPEPAPNVAGVFVCFAPGGGGVGAAGDPGWGAAVGVRNGRTVGSTVVDGPAGAPYRPGFLAAREGPLLEAAVRALPAIPGVVLVNATGRDHPRRAGLALHLGWVLGVPTIGITHRPLVAAGTWPELVRGARTPLTIDGELVGWWLCSRPGARPIVVHAGWRTDPGAALEVALASLGRFRTPEPLRRARRLARSARARPSEG